MRNYQYRLAGRVTSQAGNERLNPVIQFLKALTAGEPGDSPESA